MKKTCLIYDDAAIKWQNDGRQYAARFEADRDAEDPRAWENIALMACFHGHYNLGDYVGTDDPERFWQRLVGQYVPEMDTDDLNVEDCQNILEPFVEWLPLWLYDHSGLSVSCGLRKWPYNDPWDSGCVGWIVAGKDKVVSETMATEDNWREKAVEVMESEVKTYDQFLRGECYGYVLYEKDGDDWNEIDSCWGYYGDDILDNGMADQIGCGLHEAILAGDFETATPEKHASYYYTF